MCLAQGSDAGQVTQVRLEPAALRSRVKPSTTEPLLSHKACVKQPSSKRPKIGFKTDIRSMEVKSVAECCKGSILQYFWPLLSYHLSFRSVFYLVFSGRFTQVLLYFIK